MNTLLEVDGTVVMGNEMCREQLAECFEELYNVPPPAERLAGGAPRANVATDLPTGEDLPSYQEAERVDLNRKGTDLLGFFGSPPSYYMWAERT